MYLSISLTPSATTMIIEERIYTCHCGKAAQYVKAYQQEGLAIQRPILGHLVGYFLSDIGELNQVVHMWAYEDLMDRARRRALLLANPDWKSYAAKVQPFVLTQQNKILVPAEFSPWADGPAYRHADDLSSAGHRSGAPEPGATSMGGQP
ncbi:NIPSNAP family protein [Pollutimonas bauzanensis]|uniref:NIPSNAP protein n=1 Tax=Pollutimonas bauzanensis TaxID=658167 RepID=A0A1M5VI84_9BURK|nr:NIPSNAP family protein [Pollutimonas bauzanensis]SHH74969.1 NIPSNAP protein [Pollutimonas bauzanensis]